MTKAINRKRPSFRGFVDFQERGEHFMYNIYIYIVHTFILHMCNIFEMCNCFMFTCSLGNFLERMSLSQQRKGKKISILELYFLFSVFQTGAQL